jgi:hypothetical protein
LWYGSPGDFSQGIEGRYVRPWSLNLLFCRRGFGLVVSSGVDLHRWHPVPSNLFFKFPFLLKIPFSTDAEISYLFVIKIPTNIMSGLESYVISGMIEIGMKNNRAIGWRKERHSSMFAYFVSNQTPEIKLLDLLSLQRHTCYIKFSFPLIPIPETT